MKSILVIGMGKFGHHLVNRLLEFENEVMIVDQNEDNVRDLFSSVTSARVGDCTNPEVLKSLGLRNFDLVIVCIGETFQNSLEVTSLVKELGAKYVISVASRDIQAKFLLKNGADEVIYPERDVAYNLAAKCSANHVFDYIQLNDEYSIYEIPIISDWAGKTIKDVNVRAEYNVNIIGIVANGKITVMPSADYQFKENDHIKVLGEKDCVNKILKCIK
jgi:trk system potassium uptake protein TrkA